MKGPTFIALDAIEKDYSSEVAAARLAHETRAQRSKEMLRKWKEERQAALTADPPTEPPPKPPDAIDPGAFVAPRLYATDPTIERLSSLLQARPRGMTLLRDELSGLFANMGRYSGGSDRPFWLEAWNGRRHVVERVKGSIAVEHLLIGIAGGAFSQTRLPALSLAMRMECMHGSCTRGHHTPGIGH
jgi:Protein of unknown function (DUF3987)